MEKNNKVSCDGCGKLFMLKDLKHEIESVKHKHHSATKAQKRIVANVRFHDLDRDGDWGSDSSLCLSCRILIMQGMYNGRMWE